MAFDEDGEWVSQGEDDEYPRFRVRRIVVRVVALTLIVGLLLAFPLGYLIDAELRNQHLEAGLALIEAVILAVVVVLLRSGRRI